MLFSLLISLTVVLMDIVSRGTPALHFLAIFRVLSFHCRCDCDRQALMTALHTCCWIRAEWFLLNTDVASASGARASLLGSASAGHRLRTKKLERIVDEGDDKVFFALARTREEGWRKNGRGEKEHTCFFFLVVVFIRSHIDWAKRWKPLQCYWNAADAKLAVVRRDFWR